MNWLLANVRPPALLHRLPNLLPWNWIGRTTQCIVHHHVNYKVTIEHAPVQLTCARCGQIPSVPKKTECGKTVCRKCVGYNNQCPLCTSSSCIASHNSEYTQQINKLKAKCPIPQCRWNGKVAEVTQHLQQCGDIIITCQQCGTRVPRKHQFKHEDCCPLQKRNCFYCKKEGYAKDIIKHEKTECPWRKVECPNRCGDLDIFHDKLEVHVEELCPLRSVLCKRCNKGYMAEDFAQHWCVPPSTHASTTQPLPDEPQPKIIQSNNQAPPVERQAVNCSLSAGHSDMESNLPQLEATSRPLPENTSMLPVTIPYAEYTTQDNAKLKTETLQRLVISCITLCLLSTVAYLRNQRVTDVEFEHDMEIPSVLLWSIFTSTLVFLTILGGSSCYKDLFKAINAKECIVIALAISFIHLIRFYPNYCLQIILGSLCGSAVEVFLFHKCVTTFPGQFTNTIWVMTQFVAIVLIPFIIIYYSSISNLRVAVMQLVYIIYIMVLRGKQRLETIWNNMTQENRTMGSYLVNGIVMFSIILYSVTAISYEVFSTSCSSLKILLVAILPVAYGYTTSMEGVQDLMLDFGEKLYKSSICSFWGRLCMVSVFYYTMIICLIIPIIQETGDFIVGSALASVLIVYSMIVKTGLFSKQILEEESSDNPIKWYGISLTDMTQNCCALLKIRFIETDIHQTADLNDTTLTLLAELDRNTKDALTEETIQDNLAYTLSLLVSNKQWTSCNEEIRFSSQHIFGPMLTNKLGSARIELSNRDRYLNDKNAITLNIQLSH